MLSEQRRVSQMAIILRLRAMQGDKASQRYAQTANALTHAKETLSKNQCLYAKTAEHFLRLQEEGTTLDPALYETRLQGLLGLRQLLTESEKQIDQAKADLLAAKAALSESRVNTYIAENALATAEATLGRYWLAQESIEAADAQLAKEGYGGV